MRFLRQLSFLGLLGITSCATTGSRSPSQLENPLEAVLSSTSCALWRDSNGVAHVKGDNEKKAYACLGYLHGRDRAFHMDYIRRATQGRLSEVLGASRLKDDFFLRMMGFAE